MVRRRTLRLKGYDYSSCGSYFITILTRNRHPYFTEYPALSEIVKAVWHDIPNRYPNIDVDEFIVMPDHIHGIITIRPTSNNSHQPDEKLCRPTLGNIVGSFKSICVNRWLKYIDEKDIDAIGKFWHSNYFERIIRRGPALKNTQCYIRNNKP